MPIGAGLGYLIGAGISAAGNIGMNAYQNYKNESFYNKYSSPAAMMAQMAAAGINPAAAAQGISGSGGPNGITAASPTNTFGEVGNLIAQSVLANATKENIEADTEQKKAGTAGQVIENKFNEASFDDRLEYVKNERLISEETYKQAKELTEKYPEILEQSIEQTKSEIRKNDKQVEVYDQQIKNLKKEIDKIEQEIKLMKSQMNLNSALAGEANSRAKLADAETVLTEKKQQLADVEKKKAELGADSNVELKYREIEKKQGKEAADKWLQGQYDIVNKIEQGVQDANVMTKEQRKIIEDYDKRIAKAEQYLDECEERYYNAGSLKKSWHKGEMEAAQTRVNNLRKEKAEQLRRLGINESSSTKVGPVGTSKSK